MQPTGLLQRLEWRARHAVTTTVSGDYRSAFRGRGMEFDQVVKYEWGDDPRDIDWNVTARLGEPYRKRFVEERDLSVILVVEDSPALQFGSEGRTRRETLLEAAALLMLISSINKDRVGLWYVAPGRSWFQRALPGRKDIMRVTSQLLSQSAPPLDGPPQCQIPWRMLRKVASRGSVLLWLGPFMPAPLPEGWRELQRRYQTVGVRADDQWDVELPEDARFAAYDPIAGRLTTIDTSAPAQRSAHRRWRGEREAHFTHLFARHDERLKILNTEDPLQALVAYFHRHRRGADAAA
ncbi:MAG TPA: DUF58 domain-containing protein [Steroidobacteraceae bacterium]|jgi:uncharacterized protein (DUF58 family)